MPNVMICGFPSERAEQLKGEIQRALQYLNLGMEAHLMGPTPSWWGSIRACSASLFPPGRQAGGGGPLRHGCRQHLGRPPGVGRWSTQNAAEALPNLIGSFLDAAPHGHPQLLGPDLAWLLHTPTPVPHPGGRFSALATGPDAAIRAAQRFL